MMKFKSVRYLDRYRIYNMCCGYERVEQTFSDEFPSKIFAYEYYVEPLLGDEKFVRLTDNTLYNMALMIVMHNDIFNLECFKGVNDEEHFDNNVLILMGIIVDMCCDTVFIETVDDTKKK